MPRLPVCAVLLLCSVLSIAQEKTQPANPAGADVAPDDFVILVTGACETKPGEFAVRDCIRGVTREEFEALMTIAAPNATLQARQKIAESLGEVIILSNEAKKRELPKDPAVKEMLKFTQLQTLAGLLVQHNLKKEAGDVPPAEIEEYYNAHLGDYQSADLQKIVIPQAVAENTDRNAFAEQLQKRCAAGEDPAKLQAETDEKAKRPATKLIDVKNQRKNFYPANDQPVFDLKSGQCSVVMTERNDLVIFKVTATKAIPLTEARDAIAKTLETTRLKDAMDKIKSQNVISLNGKYFDTAGSPQPPSAQATPKK